jgi:hypothetical protein
MKLLNVTAVGVGVVINCCANDPAGERVVKMTTLCGEGAHCWHIGNRLVQMKQTTRVQKHDRSSSRDSSDKYTRW